jgi:hypothetical protein
MLSLLLLVVVLIAWGFSSFLVDPENIGVRLALYALGLLALLAAIVFAIVALVRRRARGADRTNSDPIG